MSLLPHVSNTTIDRNAGLGALALLPDELLFKIIDLLSVIEAVGLIRVSRQLRAFVHDRLNRVRELHYEPWAVDPAMPDLWAKIGNADPIHALKPDRENELYELAGVAYDYMSKNVQKALGRGAAPGVGCEWIAKISRGAKTARGDTFYNVNCVAALKIGEMKIWATNFTYAAPVKQLTDALEKAGYSDQQVTYALVPHRHAEMRLMMHLGDVVRPCELAIDKVCCLFCASQIVSLGQKHLVTGWNRGTLNWYTFSPLIVYFKAHRLAMWGELIENAFSTMSLDERIFFLLQLVGHDSNAKAIKRIAGLCEQCRTPKTSIRKHDGTSFIGCPNWRNHASSSTGRKRERDEDDNNNNANVDRCAKCGAAKKRKKGQYGWFMACPNWFAHK